MRILVDEDRELHPFLEELKEVAKGVCYMLGNKGEVIIHDLSTPESSVCYIAGEVTNRKLGAPATDMMLQVMKSGEAGKFLNYQTTGKNGHVYKSSMMFIKDESKEIIGCLGINYDITDVMMVTDILKDFSSTLTGHYDNPEDEVFEDSINGVLKNILKKGKKKIGKSVTFMTKEDKLELIKFLNEKGCFLVKGSVEIVAEDLDVSIYTIYNYIKKIGG